MPEAWSRETQKSKEISWDGVFAEHGKVETGESTETQEYLTFDDLETPLRVLTPTRWTLLRFLRREGPMSIRALSNALRRDYKNVHTDVKELRRVGLVTLTVDRRIMVPWDAVRVEVRLEAA